MHALALLLGSRALDLSRPTRRAGAVEAAPGPIASTPERAAAWRRWATGEPPTDHTRQVARRRRVAATGTVPG